MMNLVAGNLLDEAGWPADAPDGRVRPPGSSVADAAVVSAIPAKAPSPGGRPSLEAYLAEGDRRGLRWSGLRAAMLRLLWSAGGPLSAYEIARRLPHGDRSRHPTSVYRNLERLQQAGLVVQIVTWRQYLLVPDPAVALWGALLCRECRSCTLVDLSAERERLDRQVRQHQFRARLPALECEGRCRACAAVAAAS